MQIKFNVRTSKKNVILLFILNSFHILSKEYPRTQRYFDLVNKDSNTWFTNENIWPVGFIVGKQTVVSTVSNVAIKLLGVIQHRLIGNVGEMLARSSFSLCIIHTMGLITVFWLKSLRAV